MSRRCARPACGAAAVATLAYDYKARVVWLGALADEAHPATHDLCAIHAERLSAPQGWTVEDRRGPHALPSDPAKGGASSGATSAA
ncbi:MAG TPA: DUF3499 family protein [Acidimicrobiales bacterium]|jgi:hypothetical protein